MRFELFLQPCSPPPNQTGYADRLARTEYLKANFDKKLYSNCLKNKDKFIESGHLLENGNKLSLTKSGMFISDTIISEMLSV